MHNLDNQVILQNQFTGRNKVSYLFTVHLPLFYLFIQFTRFLLHFHLSKWNIGQGQSSCRNSSTDISSHISRSDSINFSEMRIRLDRSKKDFTSSPVKAVNLDSTTGSFLRDRVMTSDRSDMLLLISRNILSTLLWKK